MQKNSKPKEKAGKRIVHSDTSVFGAKISVGMLKITF